MELICKREKAATTPSKTMIVIFFALLLGIFFSCLQFHSYPNLSSWQRRWQLFQTQLNWKTGSVTMLNQKEQNLSSQKLEKPEEIRRSDMFGKQMAEVFRRRAEQVEQFSIFYQLQIIFQTTRRYSFIG